MLKRKEKAKLKREMRICQDRTVRVRVSLCNEFEDVTKYFFKRLEYFLITIYISRSNLTIRVDISQK